MRLPVRNMILFLPSWYPSDSQSTDGIFIRKHALEISKKYFVHVFFVRVDGNIRRFKITKQIRNTANLTEEIVTIGGFGKYLNNLLHLIISNFLLAKNLINNRKRIAIVNLNVVYHAGIIFFPILIFIWRKLVVTEHWTGYFPEDGRFLKLSAISRNIIARIFKKAAKVIAISEVLKIQLNELFKIENNITIINNKLSVPNINSSACENQLFEILTIAYLDDKSKNISGILRAFKKLVGKYKEVKLVIVGDGNDRRHLEKLCSELQLSDKVTFTGNVSNDRIGDFYLKASLFVLNSNFETFNIATAEALLYGLPAIVTKCRGPEGYFKPVFGKMIEKGNNDQLAKEMEYFYLNRSEFNRNAIANEAKKVFMVDNLSDRFAEVFDEVLNSKKITK